MRRKIIKQGASTLTVSLPASWAKKFSLNSGDEINLEEDNKKLIISTQKEFKSKKSEINISSWSRSLVFVSITNVYIRGDDEVIVKYKEPKEADWVMHMTESLIGYEAVEQTKNHLLIRDLSGNNEVEFDMIERRLFRLVLFMAKDGLDCLKKKDITQLKELWIRDREVNKFCAYCLRILNKKGHKDFEKTQHHYNVIQFLELLGDEYSRLYKNTEKGVRKELIPLFEQIVKMNEDFYNLFYNYDPNLAMKILDQKNDIRDQTKKVYKNVTSEELQFTYRMRKIAELIADIMKIMLVMMC
ncbi:phosphate uptake regulator PhoU [Candidatus Woesearchaeota archaeon]|jgi:phosphate uptake regulator|nr:phosphate uptake regulator PhoU [Candidatus Woesearchaeota archaeon]